MPAVLCAAVLAIGLQASEARPVVEGVPPPAEALAQAAERAFDEGRFAEAAQQASLAVGELAQGPRGPAIEQRTRELEMVWGAALASADQGGLANAHFRSALQNDPDFVPSADRFAPPMRQRVDRIRKEVARASASATLHVTGTIGAAVYLDGIARGSIPSSIKGVPGSQGWIWIERNGARSLAYPVTFGVALAPIELEPRAEEPHPIASTPAPTSAAAAPLAATLPPPEPSVTTHQSGSSPVVWIALAAVGVAAGIAIGVAVASASTQTGMSVGIQSSPGHP